MIMPFPTKTSAYELGTFAFLKVSGSRRQNGNGCNRAERSPACYMLCHHHKMSKGKMIYR